MTEDTLPVGGNAKERIKAFIERVENLTAEKKTFADDIKEVYAEAKSSGFDVRALRECVKLRAKDAEKLKNEKAILDIYLNAIGMDFLL